MYSVMYGIYIIQIFIQHPNPASKMFILSNIQPFVSPKQAKWNQQTDGPFGKKKKLYFDLA